MGSATIGRAASMRPPRRSHRERPTGVDQPVLLPGRTDGSPGIRRGSWGTQDGTAGRRSCLNAVFRALYVAEENYEVRTRKTHTGLGGNAILRFSSGNSGRAVRDAARSRRLAHWHDLLGLREGGGFKMKNHDRLQMRFDKCLRFVL